MKLACHKARALSRVAITILVGVDELGIPIKIKKSLKILPALILPWRMSKPD
jgi:hypothetical protein